MTFKEQLLKQNYGDKKFLKSRKYWKKYNKYHEEWLKKIREKKRLYENGN